VGLYNGSKKRVYTEKGEDVSIVKGREERDA